MDNLTYLDSVTCFKCSDTFASHSDLQVHITDVHCINKKIGKDMYTKYSYWPQTIHKCPECQFGSKNRRSFLHHYESNHLSVSQYSCDMCSNKYVNNLYHYLFHDTVIAKSRFELKVQRNQHLECLHFECSSCDFSLEDASRTKEELQALMLHHQRTTHAQLLEDQKFKCEICGLFWPSKLSLQDHVVSEHDRQKHKCQTCGQTFASAFLQLEHQQKVHMQLTFSCQMCGLEFKTPSKLVDHQGVNHGLFGYLCSLCGYRSDRLMFLNRHLKSRHSEKKFKCSRCPFRSAQRWCVQQHVRLVHEKSQLFLCPHCDYTSTAKGNLNSHIQRIHLGARNILCKVCGFRARRKKLMTEHMVKDVKG